MPKIERFDPASLTRETSLTEIYRGLRSEVKEQPFNLIIGGVWAATVALNVSFSTATPSSIAQSARALAETGIGFAASILGFLLAGFTIFATMSKTDLLVGLATHSEKKGRSSYLKLGYFSLIEVFIDYVFFVVICLALRLLCIPHSGFAHLINLVDHALGAKSFLCKVALWFVSSGFLWIVLKLKSFIFNIYHLVMTSVRWEVEKTLNQRADEYVDDVLKVATADEFNIDLPTLPLSIDVITEAFERRGYLTEPRRPSDKLHVFRDPVIDDSPDG